MKPSTHAYTMTQAPANDAGVAQTGGEVKRYTPASTFSKGDVCYISAAGTVSKSATTANYAGFQGVVVGGDLTGGALDADNGTSVCTATTGYVLVQISGIAYVRAEGTVTVGTHFAVICTGTTAGRVIAGTTAGQMLGTPLETAATGDYFRILIRHR